MHKLKKTFVDTKRESFSLCSAYSPTDEHWLGLKKVYALTKNRAKKWILRIDLWDHEGGTAFAQYQNFRLGHGKAAYKLHVGKYSGTAGTF